ncbi:MAG: hypothetical protein RMI34_09740 [Chloroherpetonaceae bacterium]|nr:hypothetical protein [Chloroherpetonaceae bacterium]MCS7211062.1 hypothetical protein [Chloroherpetonaceae bacterium]MDW8020340.1 hypothetical protein [Chloroherpetonaceae bacterium]
MLWQAIPMMMALVLCTFFPSLEARDIRVSNVRLLVQSPASESPYTVVMFDLSWKNSWRDEINWDAAWVFVKYQTNDGIWKHATLSVHPEHHFVPDAFELSTVPDAKGVFIYRRAEGQGDVVIPDVQLRWLNREDRVTVRPNSAVRVFALEMVYVPEGPFQIGDGSLFNVAGNFTDPFQTVSRPKPERKVMTFRGLSPAPTRPEMRESLVMTASGIQDASRVEMREISRPARIESERELLFGNSTADNFGNSDGKGMLISDDVPRTYPSVAIPEHFPKGFAAFYCMKYEISQGEYAAFLNTLTDIQAANLAPEGSEEYRYTIYAENFSFKAKRPERACNYLEWKHGTAFLDWAALRPMTELEYEKAARGTRTAVANEYAWGRDNPVAVEKIIGEEDGTEKFYPENANCNFGMRFFEGGDGGRGALRCGFCEKGNLGRKEPGASYYGIAELSGNLWEQCITVGDPQGRRFTGLHGDGELDYAGNANVERWASGVNGMGYRGGSWSNQSFRLRISDRQVAVGGAVANTTVTAAALGFRGVRTAPPR